MALRKSGLPNLDPTRGSPQFDNTRTGGGWDPSTLRGVGTANTQAAGFDPTKGSDRFDPTRAGLTARKQGTAKTRRHKK